MSHHFLASTANLGLATSWEADRVAQVMRTSLADSGHIIKLKSQRKTDTAAKHISSAWCICPAKGLRFPRGFPE